MNDLVSIFLDNAAMESVREVLLDQIRYLIVLMQPKNLAIVKW